MTIAKKLKYSAGVGLLSVLAVGSTTGCAFIFEELIMGNRNQQGIPCNNADSIYCDTWCDGTYWLVPCDECDDYDCDYEEDDGC